MRSKARATFCASHESTDGVLHGHSYEVWATWQYGGEDIVPRQLKLAAVVSQLDHTVLPEYLRTAERIAKFIADEVGAIAVEVRRPVEGLEGCWP